MEDEKQTVSEQSWKERQKQQLRQGLIAAALQLFEEKGFEAPSVDEITARTGIAKGTFYLYFKTKSDILAVMFEHTLEQLENKINGLLADAPVDAPETLRAVLQMQGEFFEQHPVAMPLLIDGESALMSQLDSNIKNELCNRCRGITVQVYERILRTGILQRHYREVDPVLAAKGLYGMLTALIKESIHSEQPVSAAVEVITDLFERGVKRSLYQQ